MSDHSPEILPTPGLPIETSSQASAEAVSSDDRTIAMLAELLQLFAWIIGPLVIFFVKRDSKFVRFHAVQAMLWQGLLVVLYIVFFAMFIPVMIASTKTTPDAVNRSTLPLIWMASFWLFFALAALANLVLAIYFAVKANSGQWSRYPVIGRLAWRLVCKGS